MRFLIALATFAMIVIVNAPERLRAQEAEPDQPGAKKEAKAEAKAPNKEKRLKAQEIKIAGLRESRSYSQPDSEDDWRSSFVANLSLYSSILLSIPMSEIPREKIVAFAFDKNFKITSELDHANLLQTSGDKENAMSRAMLFNDYPGLSRETERDEQGRVWWKPNEQFNKDEEIKDLRIALAIKTPARAAKNLLISGDILFKTSLGNKEAKFTCTKKGKPGQAVFTDKEADLRIEIEKIGKRSCHLTISGKTSKIVDLDGSDAEGNLLPKREGRDNQLNDLMRRMNQARRSNDDDAEEGEQSRFQFDYDGGLPLSLTFKYSKGFNISRLSMTLAKNTILLDEREPAAPAEKALEPVENALTPTILSYHERRHTKEGAFKRRGFERFAPSMFPNPTTLRLRFKMPDVKGSILRYTFEKDFCISTDGASSLVQDPFERLGIRGYSGSEPSEHRWQGASSRNGFFGSSKGKAGHIDLAAMLKLPHKNAKSLQINGLVLVDILQELKAQTIKDFQGNRKGAVIWESADKEVSIEIKTMTLDGEIALTVKGKFLRLKDLAATNENGHSCSFFLQSSDQKQATFYLSESGRESLHGNRKRASLKLSFQAADKIVRKKIPLFLKEFKLP